MRGKARGATGHCLCPATLGTTTTVRAALCWQCPTPSCSRLWERERAYRWRWRRPPTAALRSRILTFTYIEQAVIRQESSTGVRPPARRPAPRGHYQGVDTPRLCRAACRCRRVRRGWPRASVRAARLPRQIGCLPSAPQAAWRESVRRGPVLHSGPGGLGHAWSRCVIGARRRGPCSRSFRLATEIGPVKKGVAAWRKAAPPQRAVAPSPRRPTTNLLDVSSGLCFTSGV